MTEAIEIAVIVPIYNALSTLSELITRLEETLQNISENYQIILIDDCGPEPVWPVILQHSLKNHRVIGLRHSRNFGQHAAITSGLKFAKSEWYVVMDCDLQDRPEDIILLHREAIEKNHDSVLAVRGNEEVARGKKLGSKLFNFALNKLANIPVSTDVGNFRIFNDKMFQAYHCYQEQMRLFPALMSHLGFDVGRLEITRPARVEGKSGYSFAKLFELGFNSIVSNTIKPVYFMAVFGFFVAASSIVYSAVLVIRKFAFDITVEGWASTMAVILILGGVQIFAISFVGIYVGKVFFEVKNRPIAIIRDVTHQIKGK